MEHIKDILSSLLQEIEKKGEKGPKKISHAWKQIAGEKIAQHTQPRRIVKQTLYVTVDDAPWAYELSQRSKQNLIKRINNELGENTITDIHFRIGEISR